MERLKVRLRVFRDGKGFGGISLDDPAKRGPEASVLTVKTEAVTRLPLHLLMQKAQRISDDLDLNVEVV